MLKWIFRFVCFAVLGAAGWFEIQTSYLQSRVFSRFADRMTFDVEAGPSSAIIFPTSGPYNERQGFTHLESLSKALPQQGYAVTQQATLSKDMQEFIRLGGNPPYKEKSQTGLSILDNDGIVLHNSQQPQRIYKEFEDIPPLLVSSLLFIEDQHLLEEEYPDRNPAVDWWRLGQVIRDNAVNTFTKRPEAAGASTLATQLEKFRYSPAGLTVDSDAKLLQMISASLRAYQHGPDTSDARRRIVLDYINSTPLAGRVGFGEIQGIGDGLWAWYGIDFDAANNLLRQNNREFLVQQAQVFKAALSLLLSQRRPSYYLLEAHEELAQLTDSYVRVLAASGVIDPGLEQAALAQPLSFRESLPVLDSPPFIRQKAVNNIRTELLSLLDIKSLYELDRFDLAVKTTVASAVQQNVEDVLQNLVDPEQALAMGLIGEKLLQADQLDAVRFSVLIYESTPDGNKLRVQTDNLNMPFDLNDGSKLDLGSTAKLRTLITYLQIIETLYYRYMSTPTGIPLQSVDVANDPLRLWVVEQLNEQPEITLEKLLEAAMTRQYSASLTELFFTAGGQHHFNNFERSDDTRVMSVNEAFNRSVNLVFIRLMRDISHFYINEIPGIEELLKNEDGPLRQAYLERFADFEGKEYLQTIYRSYRNLSGAQLVKTLAMHVSKTPYRLAMAFRAVQPNASIEAMTAFMAQRLMNEMPDKPQLQKLYNQYGRDKFNSNDRAYLAGVHPLELWLVEYQLANPGATFDEMVNASVDERQTSYAWLFKTSSQNKQLNRVRIMVEQEAFAAIHRQWQQLGYPFSSLVPSFATALGVSADRPLALAQLMGIIVNDGLSLPMASIQSLEFAAGTPYETLIQATPQVGERVLSQAISRTVRKALIEIVETGTGRRLSGVFIGPDGQPLAVGGKTGTGDHRSRRFGPGLQLLEETVVDRNAIFTFFIDDRFFGTILASVGGPAAGNFEFTSGLASQLLKILQPALMPLLQEKTVLNPLPNSESLVQITH